MKTSLVIDLAGNLESRSRRFAQALEGLAGRGGRALGALRGGAARLGGVMDALSGRYAAAIAGMGVSYKAVRAVMDSAALDKMLIRVGHTAGASAEQVEVLRRELFEMARSTGQNKDDLLGGFYALVQSGQEWDEARATIAAINPAMAVTGASAEVLAGAMGVAAQAFDFDLSKLETGRLMLDQMYAAGKLGNAELEDLASIFARVGNNAKTAGLDFEGSLAFIERLSLVERQPERLATLADSTLRLFTNQTYMSEAARVTGVDFYDGEGQRRDMFDVLADIRDRYQTSFKTDAERDKAFAQAFGKTDLDTQRGLRIFFNAESIEEARQFTDEIKNAGGVIERELSNAVNNSVDQVARLKGALGDAADEFARPVNEALSGGIKYLLDNRDLGGKELLVGGTAAAGLGFGALKLGGKVLGRLGGGALGKALGGMGGLAGLPLPLPVYVVNNRMSLTNDALSDMVGGGKPSRPAQPAGRGATGGGGARNWAGPALAIAASVGLAVEGYADETLHRDAYGLAPDQEATTAQKMSAGLANAFDAGGMFSGPARMLGMDIDTADIARSMHDKSSWWGALGGLNPLYALPNIAKGAGSLYDTVFGRDQAQALGEEMARHAAGLAESVASFSKVEIEVKGPAEARIVKNPDHGDIDVLRSGLEANGIMWMD